MLNAMKTIASNALKAVRGMDCSILHCYILEMHKMQDFDTVLPGISQCLKENLEYELLGFAFKEENRLDMWVDPQAYSLRSVETVQQAFHCQNVDSSVHYFNSLPQELHMPSVNSVSVIIARNRGGETITVLLFDKETRLLHSVPVTTS
ncbi:MAG: hypothetical protein WC291_10480 [Thermodesulfovibrionales bacterium]